MIKHDVHNKSSLWVKRVEQYGTERFYPTCEIGKLFCQLMERQTLDRRTLRLIRELGYAIRLENTETGIEYALNK